LILAAARDLACPQRDGLGDPFFLVGGGDDVVLVTLREERMAAHVTRSDVTDDELGPVRYGDLMSAVNGLIGSLGEIGTNEEGSYAHGPLYTHVRDAASQGAPKDLQVRRVHPPALTYESLLMICVKSSTSP
jgi:hypothetical protein